MNELLKKIKVIEKKGPAYRLGDAILLYNAPGAVRDMRSPKHEGTIGHEYLKHRKNGDVDYPFLRGLIDIHVEKRNLSLPGPDELVLHYRAGDAVIFSGGIIEMISDAVQQGEFKKVHIVTALYFQRPHEGMTLRSLDLLKSILQWFEENDIGVNIRSSTVDDDFCFIAKAPTLLTTIGCFSTLAGNCCEGRVYSLKDYGEVSYTKRYYEKTKGEFELFGYEK